MSKTLAMTGCLAMAAAVAWTSHLAAQSQPVRDGIRRTGEVAAEGTRAAARGTRNVINRTVDAAGNAVDNTTEATRARIDRDQRNEIQTNAGLSVEGQNDINAGTQVGGNQIQGDSNLNANQNQVQVDSRLDNQSLDSAIRRESGYRGIDQGSLTPGDGTGQVQHSGQVEYNGRAYVLRHDSQGREFICVCGRPVYFDNTDQGQQSRDAYKMSGDSIQEDRMNQDRAQQMREDRNQDRSDNRPQSGYGAVPAPPKPIRTDAADVNPAGPTLNTEAEGSADLSGNADLDTEADADIDASNSSSSEVDEAVSEIEEEVQESTDTLPTN